MNERDRDDLRADEILDRRLLAAANTLASYGYLGESLSLYERYRDNRWRLLVEYNELLEIIDGSPRHDGRR